MSMNLRDRQTPVEGGSAVAASPADAVSRTVHWEEWFCRAAPAEQVRALDLARTQGVLYAHQLPLSANGTNHPTLCNSLLSGHLASLPLHRPPLLDHPTVDLNAAQCEAVARALHTPDLCLIQGCPGTGKSRVVAEIVIR